MEEKKEISGKDVIKKMLDTLKAKSLQVAEEMNAMDIKIGETSGEGKSFEHFMKWSTEASKLADNMLALEKKCLGEEETEQEGKASSSTESPLERMHKNKNQ